MKGSMEDIKPYDQLNKAEKQDYLRALDRHLTFISHLDRFMGETSRQEGLIRAFAKDQDADISMPWSTVEANPYITVILLRFALTYAVLESVIEERYVTIERLDESVTTEDLKILRRFRNAVLHVPPNKDDWRIRRFLEGSGIWDKVETARRHINDWILWERGELEIPREH